MCNISKYQVICKLLEAYPQYGDTIRRCMQMASTSVFEKWLKSEIIRNHNLANEWYKIYLNSNSDEDYEISQMYANEYGTLQLVVCQLHVYGYEV